MTMAVIDRHLVWSNPQVEHLAGLDGIVVAGIHYSGVVGSCCFRLIHLASTMAAHHRRLEME